ncbi:toll/interleukin-1 receptor domain-containing protein [Saccharothrix luteola]|uniref:toll/interleukin-1 receptor domain-containing protein n=1 Tax=Saccharothrix luteola TaxID=2893018 RepID=UPI001E633337|nr:toll/interleukin-1 receptor domain-containing protein [Saccharothrix luteola]MCC8249354.1 TIR domain-containing protein [Saccharothrix luteola]
MTIFVSYTRADETLVRALRDDLGRMGQQVWLDHEIHGGELWWREIIRTIQAARVFVFALSQASWKSVPCHAEFDYAQQLGVPVLPVQVGPLDNLRIPIMERQLVDYRERSADAIVSLAGALTELTAQKRVPPNPMPPPPKVPFEYLYRIAELLGPQPIAPERQEIIIGQLRRHLRTERDEIARADIVKLLREFRERGEITNLNSREIDEILANVEPGEGEDLPEGVTWLSAADYWRKNPVVIGPPPVPEPEGTAGTAVAAEAEGSGAGATPAWLRNVMATEARPAAETPEPGRSPTPQWWQGEKQTPSTTEPPAPRPPAPRSPEPQPLTPGPRGPVEPDQSWPRRHAPRPDAPLPESQEPTPQPGTPQHPASQQPGSESDTPELATPAPPTSPPSNDRSFLSATLGATGIPFLLHAAAGGSPVAALVGVVVLIGLVLGLVAIRNHEPRARQAVVIASVGLLGVIVCLLAA